ncbi:MAG: hypothetical protein AAFX39_10700 [Pseudomonadota bacterium]
MKTFGYVVGGFFGFVVLAVGGVILWYMWTYPSGTLRYEMVVEVEADGEIYRGASVLEATYRHQPPLGSAPMMVGHSRGEAVVVDIGDRGTLFVLVTGPHGCPGNEEFRSRWSGYDPENIPRAVFDLRLSDKDTLRRLRYFEGFAEVPLNRMPLMVRFDDITDPLTVSQVDPCDLAASFGDGVSLSRVTIETTRASITTGIEARLPWFEDLRGRTLDGSRITTSNDLSNTIGPGSFKTGDW